LNYSILALLRRYCRTMTVVVATKTVEVLTAAVFADVVHTSAYGVVVERREVTTEPLTGTSYIESLFIPTTHPTRPTVCHHKTVEPPA